MGQPAKFSFFSYSGSPHAPSYRAFTLTGELDYSQAVVSVLYEETSGRQTQSWRATLKGREYGACVATVGRTSLSTELRFGGGYQLSLTDAEGETQTGEPLNETEWIELARRIELRHSPSALKKRRLMRWAVACGLYVMFQLLLILVWLLLFLLGIGGLRVHLILVLALLLALAGAVAGLFLWPRERKLIIRKKGGP